MNLRAEIFEDLVTLKKDLTIAANYWKNKHCPFSEQVYRQSARKIGIIINYSKDDVTVRYILSEVGNYLILNVNDAIFYKGKKESLDFANRTFALLPKGSSMQLKLLI